MTTKIKKASKRTPRALEKKSKTLWSSDIKMPWYLIVLFVILVAAFDLRFQSVEHTEVINPIRADAFDYVLYAHNLQRFGVYSRANTFASDAVTPLAPDAVRAPVYSLFLLPFLDDPLTAANVKTVTLMQALLSTLTALLVFLLCRQILSTGYALGAAALTAFSPHLVTMNIYLLTETLSCFLAVLAVFLICKIVQHKNPLLPALAGLVLAIGTLTHPMLLYFIVPLSVFLLTYWGWKKGHRKTATLALAFVVICGVWTGRNVVTLGNTGDNTLMLAALRVGAYRNMMYQDRPETYAYPYRFDPRYEETSATLGAVTKEIVDKIIEAPAAQIGWYLKKPALAWSWNMAEGPGDIFIYPVNSSPYYYLPHFHLSYVVMKWLHDLLVILMLAGIVLAWLPARLSRLPDGAVFCARVVSLLLLYHAAVMAVGFPLPRYSVPLRPFLYIMSMIPLAVAVKWFIDKRMTSVKTRRIHAKKK